MNCMKHRRIICVVLLFLMSTAFLVPTPTMGETTVREIITDMGEMIPVEKTPYLLTKEKNETKLGVFNTDGEQLIPCAYTILYYIASNCFGASEADQAKYPEDTAIPPSKLNIYALITADGTQISDFLYGKLEVFNTYWACGWVLEGSSEDDYDFVSENYFFYRIQRCDFYYLGDHALAGIKGTEELPSPLSLSRNEYKTAKAHGKYLYVQDQEGQIKIYDNQLQPVNAKVNSLNDPMYVIRNFAVVPRGTNEIVLDGFSAVQEAQTDAGLLLKVTQQDASGVKCAGVFTVDGEQLMPPTEGDISSVTKDYAVLSINNKKGLYSFKEQKLLVPCDYDNLIANATSLDPYVLHGYVCTENNGTRYYLRVADGELYEASELGEEWNGIGFAFVSNDKRNSRYCILSPDQKISYVDQAKLVKVEYRGSGYLIQFSTEDYKHAVITWDGTPVLKYFVRPFTITDDDKVIVQTKKGKYSLYEILEDD